MVDSSGRLSAVKAKSRSGEWCELATLGALPAAPDI